METTEDMIRGWVDHSMGDWKYLPEPPLADPIAWVNKNAPDLIRALSAQREALIYLAKEIDKLKVPQ
jgi:hypothetical protein